MKTAFLGVSLFALLVGGALAQPAAFQAGAPLGQVVDGKPVPMSSNVKVYGGLNYAESCSYDAERKLIVAPNRGANQNEIPNDGYVSLINPDGTVHTSKWIGANRNGLTLNSPLGSDIHGGRLYVADRNGDTADGAPSVSVVRMFDMKTGAPAGEFVVAGSPWFNDIEVASDGTIYATQNAQGVPNRVYKITAAGAASVFLEGAPLANPNGIAIDPQGNIVVANSGNDAVLTFSTAGKLLKTENAVQPGTDGLVIMADGTKYTSSVQRGGVSRIRPGQKAELIASSIPSPASMCYDPDRNQLVLPMNANNALGFLKLR